MNPSDSYTPFEIDEQVRHEVKQRQVQRITSEVSRRADGLSFRGLEAKLPDIRRTALDLALLQAIREGKVWAHQGNLYSQKHYRNAVDA